MEVTFYTGLIIVIGLYASSRTSVQIQVCLCVLGATAALRLTAIGGATITAPVMYMPFMIAKSFRRLPPGLSRQLEWPSMMLFALAAWGLISAVVMPRVFEGQIYLLPVSAGDGTPGMYPLAPSSGNITQTVYCVGQSVGFFAVHHLLRLPGGLKRFSNAVMLVGVLNAVAAVTAIVCYYTGIPDPLQYVRTAYAVYDVYESAGLVRIQGTFSETSSFSAFTLPIFAFCLSLWLKDVRPRVSGPVALISVLLLLFSTSATAYVALALYGLLFSFDLLMNALANRNPRNSPWLLVIGTVLVSLIAFAVVFELSAAERVTDYFENTVLNKADSQSGKERGFWNQQAWDAFLASGGLGVGLGSARASTYVLVLLSNLGVVGTVLFGMFLYRSYRRDANRTESPAIVSASRQAVAGTLAAACVSGAVFDLGMAFYCFAAAAAAPFARRRAVYEEESPEESRISDSFDSAE
jgi:O-Antigen ligase